MSQLLGGLQGTGCTMPGCAARALRPDDAFCDVHWRRLPRQTRVELVELRKTSGRMAELSPAYVKRLLEAALELKRMPAPV